MAQILSAIGSAVFSIPFLLVVYWCVSPVAGARGLVLLMLSSSLNELVKLWTSEPRPYWIDPSIVPGAYVDSFGMPSGHAQNAVVVWGVLAWSLGRRAAWAAAVVMALGIGWSRHALGVHSVDQILAGWGLGLAVLAAAMAWTGRLADWWRRWPLPDRLALAVLPPFVLFGVTVLAARGLGDETFPWTWVEAVRRSGGQGPRISSDTGAAGCGFLAGCLAGLAPRAGVPPLDPARGWRRGALRVLAGLAVLCLPTAAYLVMVGLASPFAPAVFALAALAGAWAVWGAPVAFERLGLAGGTPVPPRVPPSG
ncbi:phosphatase PAP2 family protein [Actinocorallia sp. B10E7]|uniref:phosphatase PAP2 family protein n=1 Tax=Actinocorallia sp. B10E7 TaxID=3153558 RepID=UPI00325C4BBD